MKDVSDEERWHVWLAQAQRFAAADNYVDAIARSRVCVQEIEKAMRGEANAQRRTRLSRLKLQAGHFAQTFEESYKAFNDKIRQRRLEGIENADDEMKRPLPLPKDFR